VRVELARPGHVPAGQAAGPARGPGPSGAPLDLLDAGVARGAVWRWRAISDRRVSERMAAACEQLRGAGLACAIGGSRHEREPAGAGLRSGRRITGCRLGAGRAGALRRSAEAIGRQVADALSRSRHRRVDRHLADQLVLAHADSEHLRTNLWLAERFGAHVRREGAIVEIEGLGLLPGAS
jgi:RNA 3'-terminal phosphate cyclase